MLPRLYAILDSETLDARGLDALGILEIWLDAGVRLVQIRAKKLSSGALLELTDRALLLTRAVGATLIVNDRADIARMSGANGVHVGQDDLPPRVVRRVIGDDKIVGLSTHTDEQVSEALREPVSYIAIGPVFPTITKTGSSDPAVGLTGVKRAAELASTSALPVVAIGGITLEAAPAVLSAGAASVAVITALLDGDPRTTALAWIRALRI